MSATVKQMYCAVPEKDKIEVLTRVLQAEEDFYGMVFCEMKSQVATLARVLTEKGFPADAIHGDRSQQEREQTLARFRKRQVKILVATDVAARGLDIKELTHVINYTMPWVVDTYVHRIGRTARNGQSGTVINIISNQEVRDLHRIQGQLKVQIEKMEIPSGQKLAEKKVTTIQENLLKALENEFLIGKALKMVEGSESALKDKTPTEIIAALLIADYSDLLFQKDIQPLTIGAGRSSGGGGVSRSRRGGGGGRGYGRRDDRGGDRRGRGGYRADVRDDRGDYGDRGERSERRSERPSRSDRPTRSASSERSERGDRAERSERRPRREGGDRASFGGARKSRSGGGERRSRR